MGRGEGRATMGVSAVGGNKCLSRKLPLTINVNDFWTTNFKFSEQAWAQRLPLELLATMGGGAGCRDRRQKGKQP